MKIAFLGGWWRRYLPPVAGPMSADSGLSPSRLDGWVVAGLRVPACCDLSATDGGGGVVAVVGLELVAGYLVAWVVRKARRAGQGLDAEVDHVMDAGLDRLHEVIADKLGDDPAVTKLEVEATGGAEVSERTH